MNGHYRDARCNKKNTVYFHLALLKYPKESFLWEIIDTAKTQEELNEKEIYWIKYYDSTNRDKGYNLKFGGNSGGTDSEETKKKIGLTTLKKWQDPIIAKKMMDGLRKGTETCKLKSLNNYKKRICQYCNNEFIYRPRDFKYIPKFCSKECLNTFLHEFSINNLKKLNDKQREEQKYIDEQNKLLIIKWVSENFGSFKKIPLNKTSILFNEIKKIIPVKDDRSIMRIFEIKSRKEFVKLLSKIYAEQVRNDGSILNNGDI